MGQEQDEIHAQVISDSAKKLLVLKTLSNFFNHKDLFAVYVRTKVVHDLFEANKNLDANKLELFHVQFTTSVIELFQKLKKAKEQQYLLVSGEMDINSDLIRKLEKDTAAVNFTVQARQHSQVMGNKLKQLYNILAFNDTVAFTWSDVAVFGNSLAQEFYRPITDAQLELFTAAQEKKTYQSTYAVVEKKLLGKLNMLNFRIKFACGLLHNDEYLEVFDFIDSNEQFVFINSTKSLYLLGSDTAKSTDLSKNTSNKGTIIAGLREKNETLNNRLATIKTSLPQDVLSVLAAYLEKISGLDFLEDMQNVDEQTNILRAMLNININTK